MSAINQTKEFEVKILNEKPIEWRGTVKLTPPAVNDL